MVIKRFNLADKKIREKIDRSHLLQIALQAFIGCHASEWHMWAINDENPLKKKESQQFYPTFAEMIDTGAIKPLFAPDGDDNPILMGLIANVADEMDSFYCDIYCKLKREKII